MDNHKQIYKMKNVIVWSIHNSNKMFYSKVASYSQPVHYRYAVISKASWGSHPDRGLTKTLTLHTGLMGV